MATLIPSRKVNAGGAVAAATVILVWAAKRFFEVDIPADIAVAISGLLTYLVQWAVPNAAEPEVPTQPSR